MRSYTVRPATVPWPLVRADGRAKRLWQARLMVVAVAVAACLPYMALKIVWLAGGSAGSATASGAAELHDTRHTIGNLITLGMELLAVLLVLALTHRRGQRLPTAILLAPIWVGTGLLAPITLGVPVGLVAQAIVGGSPSPPHNGLHGWVYAVVYGGFIVQAVTLLAAFVLYARTRWNDLFRLRRTDLSASSIGWLPRILASAGTTAASLYAVANLVWAIGGEPLAAPPDFQTVTQRSLLFSTGVLAAAGAWAVLALVDRGPLGRGSDRLLGPLTLSWLGSATCFASGIAHTRLPQPAASRQRCSCSHSARSAAWRWPPHHFWSSPAER